MKYYLAYGSNLSVEQMLYRCPTAIYVGTADLEGYKLVFKGSLTGSYLTIEEGDGTVPVLVWKIKDDDEKALDRYEGYPRFYDKKTMTVMLHDLVTGSEIGEIEAMIYRMIGEREYGLPTRGYLKVCAEGYERFSFDQAILLRALNETANMV